MYVPFENNMIVLRQWEVNDADDLFEYAGDSETACDAGWNAHYSVAESIKVIEHYRRADDIWAIDIDGKVVGCVGLHRRYDSFSRMLEYAVNKAYRGNGIATSCARAAMCYAFDRLKLEYITANCYLYNKSSEKVLTNCGFKYAKLLKNSDIKHFRLSYNDYICSSELYNTDNVKIVYQIT